MQRLSILPDFENDTGFSSLFSAYTLPLSLLMIFESFLLYDSLTKNRNAPFLIQQSLSIWHFIHSSWDQQQLPLAKNNIQNP